MAVHHQLQAEKAGVDALQLLDAGNGAIAERADLGVEYRQLPEGDTTHDQAA